jgi:HAD superfamily hydrolase (TIGR01549 family)
VSLPYGSTAVDAIVFDLDDVLVPFMTPAAWQWAWRPQGPVLGERRVRAAVRRSLKAWDRRRWRGVTGRDPPVDLAAFHRHLRDALGEVAGHSLPEVETEAVIRRLQRPAGEAERFPDVVPALERLRAANVPWGIATELPAESAKWLVRRVGIDPARLLVTGEGPNPLPDRSAFRMAADHLHFPVDRVAFVGDLFWSDARAAARAGLASILLDRHDAWPKVNVGRAVSLHELESTLAKGGSPVADEDADDSSEA